MPSVARPIGLGLVLVGVTVTLGLGAALKAPCASGEWGDRREYTRLCYSDIVPLHGTEHLTGGRLPFLDRCPSDEAQCDEYPVLTMWAMRAAAWVSHDHATFFLANAVLLALAAFATAVLLYVAVGARALYFALAPTLLVYGFMNWDLLAVALATAGTVAFLARRHVAAGALLGLGAATKLYPALLVVPFVAERLRTREPVRGVHLAWSAAAAWLAVNLPFALLAPPEWWRFFRFNAERPADWDSLWFIGCHRLTGVPNEVACGDPGTINLASLVLFVALSAGLWRWKVSRDPDLPSWTLGFPLLVAFLLTNKVYSPQYGLWLLPWFALALPNIRLFAAFEAADLAVFVTRFSWFGRLRGVGGLPFESFEVAVLLRAAILVVCLVAWVLRRSEEVPAPPRATPLEATA